MSTHRAAGEEMINQEARQGGHPSEVAGTSLDQTQGASVDSGDAPIRIERIDGDFLIEATLIGELLKIPASEAEAGIRSKNITSACESGIDADQGTYRLNLFYGGRHARVRIDASGRILHRSVIDFGDRPIIRDRARSHRSVRRT